MPPPAQATRVLRQVLNPRLSADLLLVLVVWAFALGNNPVPADEAGAVASGETSDEVIEQFADRALDGDQALEALGRLHQTALREEE